MSIFAIAKRAHAVLVNQDWTWGTCTGGLEVPSDIRVRESIQSHSMAAIDSARTMSEDENGERKSTVHSGGLTFEASIFYDASVEKEVTVVRVSAEVGEWRSHQGWVDGRAKWPHED